ncbi:MAG: hypothetical protein ACRDHN_21895, partial [Thermomicrobiales bacterium]
NEAWDLLSGWIDDDAFNNLFSVDFGRESALEDEDLPAGVADAVRIDGTDGFMNYPLCSGAYAIEPDLMVFIRAQGRITLTAGANAGINACDKIAGFVASQYPG